MVWFEQYVAEVRRHWRYYAKNIPEKTSATTSKVGSLGEDFVRAFLDNNGYEAIVSSGSCTPADVWGYDVIKSFPEEILHIMLIQVKTTYAKEKPVELSIQEQKELCKLIDCASQIIILSDCVPKSIALMPIIISAGYAGVKLNTTRIGKNKDIVDLIDDGLVEVFDSYYVYSKVTNNISKAIKNELVAHVEDEHQFSL